jgi:SAM-dependent methyltransferase
MHHSIDQTLYNSRYGQQVAHKRGYPDFRNRLRIKLFLPFVDPKPSQSILEIGCNDGMFLREVFQIAPNITGIDVNADMIAKLNDPRISVMSGTELQFEDSRFDTVFSFEVIEHIPEIEKYFKEATRVLKPGGKLVISFPFELFRGMTAIPDAIASYHNPLYCRELHVHRLFPKKIVKIIEGLSLKVEVTQLLMAPFPTFLMVLRKTT